MLQSGIRVFTANVQGPIVKGHFAFATEAQDDDGLPHTLEHLVFLGSEEYPYKGVLDLLANRCFADGTNALTDTDYTSYTVSTAGSEGFLNLLPIYLEHLLFPTLTDSSYATEVHHINSSGEDAGVVYCEMQARENTGDERCTLEMYRLLYPDCGYKYQTGGMLENFRTSTSNIKVRDYHKKFYVPKNLALIITGPIEPEQIFKAIKPIDDKIVQRGIHKEHFDRPWTSPVSPLKSSITRSIEYPCDTEEDGLVYVGFRGPKVNEDYEELIVLAVLLEYLNTNAISPIQQAFVECDNPYCSQVYYNIVENSTSCFYLVFESVDEEYLDKCLSKLISLISEIVKEQKIDMDRMSTIISRKILNILSSVECSPHSAVSNTVIGHFLYGNNNLKQRCQVIEYLRTYMTKDKTFWLNFLNRYMVDPATARYVCIVGKPSKRQMVELAETEKKRIELQQTQLRDQLPAIESRLKAAVEQNERPPPKEMLQCVPVPSLESICFHPIERVVVEESLNYRLQYDSIKTNFVTIQMLFNTSDGLDKEDRLFLPLLSESILELPIQDGQIELKYEDFVAKLFAETISYGTSIGLSSGSAFSAGSFSMLFNISMQVEPSKYKTAVDLYRQILFHTKFTPERIKTIATRMASDISQYKRSGSKVVSAALSGITYKSNSNYWATNFLRQQNFLKQTLETLKKQPQDIVDRLRRIRDTICDPKNVMLHITLDKEKIDVSSIHEPWDELAASSPAQSGELYQKLKISDITPCQELMDPATESQTVIIGVGSVESNFMSMSVPSINCPMHPDLPKLYVLIQYLTQLEGPFWRKLRGLGLTYSYSINISSLEGKLYLLLYRSTQLVEAFQEAKKIVNRFLRGEDEFDEILFDSAKSSLIFDFVKREKSAAARSMQSLVAHLRDLDIDYTRQLSYKVASVTKDDIYEVGSRYINELFDSDNRRTVVCCNPSKVDNLVKELERFNFKLEPLSLEKESILSRM